MMDAAIKMIAERRQDIQNGFVFKMLRTFIRTFFKYRYKIYILSYYKFTCNVNLSSSVNENICLPEIIMKPIHDKSVIVI